MEDLDAELLAVTDGQKRSGRADISDASDSDGGEFGGVADSDGGDDDDDDGMLDDDADDDDDDDDDDEFGLADDDDDDDDYGAKAKSKKGKGRTARGKKSAPKAKAKPRAKSSAKRKGGAKAQPASLPSDDEDDVQFEYKYDQDGYGDFADRERLQKMNEVDRETLLAERVDARSKEYDLWKMKQEMMARGASKGSASAKRTGRSSARTKQSAKAEALEEIRKIRKKSSRALEEVSDADSEAEPKAKRAKSEEKDKTYKEETKREEEPIRDDEGPEMRYSDLVRIEEDGAASTSPLFLRRDVLVPLSQQAYFARVVVGLLVRIRVGESVNDRGSYLLCRIAGVETTDEVYEIFNNYKTNQQLQLQSGDQKHLFKIGQASGSHPTEDEFLVFRSRLLRAGLEMPRREEVDKLMKRSSELIYRKKATATESENKQHIANMEIIYPARVNWTQKRTEARTALDIKRQEATRAKERGKKDLADKYDAEIDQLKRRLSVIERNEKEYNLMSSGSGVKIFRNRGKRNMALNSTNERLAASRKNLESDATGIDPFARFDTTGQSYFSIKKKGEKDEDKDVAEISPKKHDMDWRNCLESWDKTVSKRKIGDNALDPTYDEELIGLDDFFDEVPDVDDGKGAMSRIPPGIDAMYSGVIRIRAAAPEGAKIISFEEWSKMRGA